MNRCAVKKIGGREPLGSRCAVNWVFFVEMERKSNINYPKYDCGTKYVFAKVGGALAARY